VSTLHDWWNNLDPEQQESLNRIAQDSILELERYPMNYDVQRELFAWQNLELEVMQAHADWLSRTKARFERLGIPWTANEFQRRSWLWEGVE